MLRQNARITNWQRDGANRGGHMHHRRLPEESLRILERVGAPPHSHSCSTAGMEVGGVSTVSEQPQAQVGSTCDVISIAGTVDMTIAALVRGCGGFR